MKIWTNIEAEKLGLPIQDLRYQPMVLGQETPVKLKSLKLSDTTWESSICEQNSTR